MVKHELMACKVHMHRAYEYVMQFFFRFINTCESDLQMYVHCKYESFAGKITISVCNFLTRSADCAVEALEQRQWVPCAPSCPAVMPSLTSLTSYIDEYWSLHCHTTGLLFSNTLPYIAVAFCFETRVFSLNIAQYHVSTRSPAGWAVSWVSIHKRCRQVYAEQSGDRQPILYFNAMLEGYTCTPLLTLYSGSSCSI